MAKIEELMENESFVERIAECQTDDEVSKVYADFNIDLSDSAEISETELQDVVGGTDISAKALKMVLNGCKSVFKATTSYCVIMIAWYDAMRGNVTRHYTEKQIKKAAKNLGCEWMMN